MSIPVSNAEGQDRRDMLPGVNENGLGSVVEYCANGCNDIVKMGYLMSNRDWDLDSRCKVSTKTEEIINKRAKK